METTKQKRAMRLAFFSSLAMIGLVSVLALTANSDKSLNVAGVYGDTSDYTVILDSSNAYSSGSSQSITTSSKSWQIPFSYTNASALSGGHVTLGDGGILVNTNDIISVNYFRVRFDGNGSLKFRTSYDGSTWGAYNDAVSEETYNFPSNPYYVELSVSGGSTNIYSATYQYTCVPNPNATPSGSGSSEYTRVTSASDLVVGNKLVIAKSISAAGSATTLSTTQNSNNRGQDTSSILSSSDVLTPGSTTDELILGEGTTSGTWSLYSATSSGYLYAASSSKNYLRTESKLSANSSWAVTASSSTATLTAQGANTNNLLKYNSNSSIFSCYSSGQGAINLFTKSAGNSVGTPKDLVGFTVLDTKASDNYTTESVYATDNGLSVSAKYSDGSTVVLTAAQYTYVIKNSLNVAVDQTSAFGTAGIYFVTVSYGTFISQTIQINVSNPAATITGITAQMATTSYNVGDTITFASNLTASLSYSDSTSISGVSYDNLSTYGLTTTLSNPSGTGVALTSALTTAGTWTVRVALNETVYSEVSIIVSNVSVQSIALNGSSSYDLVIGGTQQLSVVFTPTNSTVTTVSWSSGDSGIASVDNAGLVTAIAVGSTTITATSTDGSKTASCTINVTAPVTPVLTGDWNLVKDASTLAAGDVLVMASNTKGYTAGDISSAYMATIGSTFATDYSTISTLGANTVQLTLGGTSGAWTLANSSSQLLGATDVRKLAWGSGTTTWSISIDSTSGDATIQNGTSTYGRFLYNFDYTKFTTYTSATSTSMLLPQLYRGGTASPIYATAISLPSTANVSLNGQTTLTPTFTPSDTNQKSVTWTSDNSSIASVSGGVVTGVGVGTTIINASVLNESGATLTASCSVTVQTVAVTGVSLSETSIELSKSGTKTLSATVLPTDASNKNVSWSVNNSIVSVDSNGLVTAGTTAGTSVVTVTTVDGSKTATCSVNVTEQVLDKYTVMIYMCGSDLESGSRLATGDLKEIANVTGQPDNVNVIVEAGGAKSWASTYSSVISGTNLSRFHLENQNFVSGTKDTAPTKASMGKTSTFQSFLEWGLTQYPAEKTAVIMWNHGGGMYGVCYDENYSYDSLLNTEVNAALSGAFASTGRSAKLEWIGYDACLMQVQDIAEFNTNYFNYMIASEESESGEGWDYDGGWLGTLFTNPSTATTTILKSNCDSFISSNGTTGNDQTLSVLDLSKMSAYKSAFEDMASYMYSTTLSTSNRSTFNTLMDGCKTFAVDADNSQYYFCLIDIQDFINKFQASSSFNSDSTLMNKVSATETALGNLVAYSKKGNSAGNAYGLALFYCWNSTYSSYASGAYTTSQTNFTNWRSINFSIGYC